MSRPYRARAIAAVLAIVAAGCQDYNFNPVGHCLLQPGTQSFTLSNVSSADVLFVVDDSGSMAGKQLALSNAFGDFVQNLTSTNTGRANSGLLPLDFHVAVTTTSVFYNRQTTQTCAAGCAGAGGQLACCVGSTAVFGPKACAAAAVGTTTGCPAHLGVQTTCSNTCNGLKGSPYCCNADGSFPPFMFDASLGLGALVTCSVPGLSCGNLQTHYDFSGCNPATKGVGIDELPFANGDFVGVVNTVAVTANPRVLHFDKRLYLASDGANAQGFTKSELITYFRQNVNVGTCGSAEEQGLVASRHAIEKALTSTQLDTYAYDWARGLGSTTSAGRTPQSFTAPGGIPKPAASAVWPTPSAKLVVVYVGDEDDCSSPADPSGGVVLTNADTSGNDACVRDATDPAPLGGKQLPVQSFVDYLTGLGRPLGAAFIVSARSSADPTSCTNETCFADLCCDFSCAATCPPPSGGTCGGQAPGRRFVDAAAKLKAKGADVLVGSVCDQFGPLLSSVADIVKPPQTLSLPSLPAESAIAILRIADGSGGTRKICGRPLSPQQPTNYTRAQAESTGADWWFTATANPGVGADSGGPYDPDGAATVSVPSRFVYINPKGSCIANPGETYSADYLGRVPAGGCQQTPATDPLGALDCQAKLGGTAQDWQCYIPPGAPSNTIGTCTCRGGI